jgi:hypothetical protein
MQRRTTSACALLVTSAVVLAACHSGRGAPVSAAQTYFQDRLHLDSSTVVASRTGNECAVVVLRAPDGRSVGVAVVLQGRPIKWEAVGMSVALRLSGYRDDGDVGCGLANIPQRHAAGGLGEITGALRTAGGPAPGRAEALNGRVDIHAGRPNGPLTTVAATHDGGFHVGLAPGRYWLVGHSPQIKVNGSEERCAALRPVQVHRGQATRADVFCQIR